jgi:hypothetical protein
MNPSHSASCSRLTNSFGLCACRMSPGPQTTVGIPACANRLTDDAGARFHAAFSKIRNQPAHPDAADSLVVRKGEVHRRRQARRRQPRKHRQAYCDEALHVAGPAPVQAPVGRAQHERVRIPGLTVHRHRVRVPGEDHASIALADRGELCRLCRLCRKPLERCGPLSPGHAGRPPGAG